MFNLVPRSRGFMPMPRMFSDVENLFDSFFKEPFFKEPFYPEFFQSSADMKLDIRESEKEYTLEADLPGLKKEDLHLEFANDLLTIAVERDEEVKEEQENYLRKERRIQSMSRRIPLTGVKEQEIKAKYENGVLHVTLPKIEVSEPKKQQINIE